MGAADSIIDDSLATWLERFACAPHLDTTGTGNSDDQPPTAAGGGTACSLRAHDLAASGLTLIARLSRKLTWGQIGNDRAPSSRPSADDRPAARPLRA
ncbi:MAG TPA: hypothetical protein DDZ76_10145, partial [Xanthomonadales bacterium]|nr:hypothetical protein [Xanthomonadales bacterium]